MSLTVFDQLYPVYWQSRTSNEVPREFVYGHLVYDTVSTDISSTTVYQRTGPLYIQLLFQQFIIFINSLFSSIPTSTYTVIPFYQSHFHLHMIIQHI